MPRADRCHLSRDAHQRAAPDWWRVLYDLAHDGHEWSDHAFGSERGVNVDHAMTIRALPWRASVEDVVSRWPAACPLAALVSAPGGGNWSRWSILASPSDTLMGMRDAAPVFSAKPRGAVIREARNSNGCVVDPADLPPFVSGWIGWIGYDAGRAFEPSAYATGGGAADDRGWPPAVFHRCAGAYVHDPLRGQWWRVGDAAGLPEIDCDEPVRVDSAPPELRVAMEAAGEAPHRQPLTRTEYERMAARAIEHIHAGDVFQVNLARRLSWEFNGSPRTLFVKLLSSMAPWYGGYIEGPPMGEAILSMDSAPVFTVLSMSPELFLRVEAGGGRIVTRPIKGTSLGSEPSELLRRSEKDIAELAMIVDLMRNDLGRICEYGSVRVEEARTIERHGSVREGAIWHGVSTIAGRVREEVSLWDVIRATMPAGSITGAPKIRAMRIIDELEPVRRGPYCGSVGFFDDSGACEMNVAIRTAAVSSAAAIDDSRGVTLDYFVGAGIVADSEPAREWEETEAKAAGFRRAIQSFICSPDEAAI